MNALRICLTVVSVALTATSVSAQSAIQLPTFRTGTTFSVPDRGSVCTGGFNRVADGRGWPLPERV